MQIRTDLLDLTFKHPFAIARYAPKTIQTCLLVELEQDGLIGFGTATPSLYYGGEDLAKTSEVIRASQEILQKNDSSIETIMAQLSERFPAAPAARAALDMALHDLAGKRAEQPLYRYWGLNPDTIPLTSHTIGIDSIACMLKKLQQTADFPIIKLKAGFDGDVEMVQKIREHTHSRLRIDANTGWDVTEAVERIKKMEALDIELIEQPIAPGNYEGLRYIREHVGVPIMADEDVRNAKDLPALAGCVDMINIKLMKCGGLCEARRMIERARDLGFKIMLGCMAESTVGITAAAHLAPLVDYVDLDAPLLITETEFEGVEYEKARLRLPENRFGIGAIRTGH